MQYEAKGQISVAGQMSGLGFLERKDVQGPGIGLAIFRLVVGPDARLPRTSPVTLDVLTG